MHFEKEYWSIVVFSTREVFEDVIKLLESRKVRHKVEDIAILIPDAEINQLPQMFILVVFGGFLTGEIILSHSKLEEIIEDLKKLYLEAKSPLSPEHKKRST